VQVIEMHPTAEKLLKKWGEAKVPNCLPQRFRHSFGTGLLVKTRDLRLVQEAMGHEDIASTALYTKVTFSAPARGNRAARLGL